MAAPQAKIQEMPDLVCVGTITEVSEAKAPAEGKDYHTLTFDIEAAAGGRDTKYLLCFQPEWFDRKFDDKALEALAEKDQANNRDYGPYWMYGKTVNHQNGKTTLQTLAACKDAFESTEGSFDRLISKFSAVDGTMDGPTVQDILRNFLLGLEVGYVLRQRSDKQEDGSKVLTEQYQVNSFFVPDAKGMEYWTRSKGRRPRIVTWNED
jgi:hypothetical protein